MEKMPLALEGEKIQTLSDLYRPDCPGDIILVPHNASTYKPAPFGDDRFVNKHQYRRDDNYEENKSQTENKFIFKCLVKYKVIPILGDQIHIVCNKFDYPSQTLREHWAEVLNGGKSIRVDWAEFGTNKIHLTRQSFEKLPSQLHCVSPDVMHQVTSKEFIGTIPCPQAPILHKITFPCVLKLCRSEAGHGVWFINNEHQYHTQIKHIQDLMPNVETIATEYIDNKVATYNVYFYVRKCGGYQWIGAAEQITKDERHWDGCVYELDEQARLKKLFQPCVAPVAQALHQAGFFGIVNIDIIVNDQDKVFVCDINPRWGDSTIALLGLHKLSPKGFRASMMIADVILKGPLSKVINVTVNLKGAKGMVATAHGQDDLYGDFVIFGTTLEACKKGQEELKEKLGY